VHRCRRGHTLEYTTSRWALSIALNSGDVASLRTGGAGSATTGNNKTITLVSTRDLALGSRLLWSAGSPVTCSGYSVAPTS
jgi:hypothetical protein